MLKKADPGAFRCHLFVTKQLWWNHAP